MTIHVQTHFARAVVAWCASAPEPPPLNLLQLPYQAVRLLSGDIRPEQFLTGAGEEDGFFDALANGPVSTSSVEEQISATGGMVEP